MEEVILGKGRVMAECHSAERALAWCTLVAQTQQSYWISDRFYITSPRKR